MKKLWIGLLLPLLLWSDKLPLEGREYGVEFNFPRLLTYSDDWKSVSGTFSYFDYEDKVEWAMPWMIASEGSEDSYSGKLKTINLDLHYRKYLADELNGFYISGFARLTRLDGKLQEGHGLYQKTLKLGVGAGLGFRILPKNKRFYWGAGLIVGRYLGNQNDIYDQSGVDWLSFDDMPVIVDVEFLKFGYAF